MSKTIKQLADELGVSKTAIRKRFTPEFRENYIETTENGVILITENGCKQIAETLQSNANSIPQTDENRDSTSNNEIIFFLQKQLEEKDRQLKEKDKQIESLTTALLNEQQSAQQAHALHAGTIQHQLTGGAEQEEPEPKKRWWKFGK